MFVKDGLGQPSLHLHCFTQTKTRRGKEERRNPPTPGFLFATAINTVFTDEVMQLVLRGQQKEAGGGHPGAPRGRGEVQEQRGHSQARKHHECGEACF